MKKEHTNDTAGRKAASTAGADLKVAPNPPEADCAGNAKSETPSRLGRPVTWIILAEAICLVVFSGLLVRRFLGATDGSSPSPAASGPAGRPKAPPPRAIGSKPAHPRVVIEKSRHLLTLYDGDVMVKSYRCAIGGGRRDKVREGDHCTPEGQFYICVKNPNSKYVLSLGLSYPNEEDAARGLRDNLIGRKDRDRIVAAIRDRRQPPWDTPLGGEIMIHGCGAGRDWTLGCIALDNDDIRELYRLLPVGTQVHIRP